MEKEYLHRARGYTPIDRLLVSGSTKNPADGDILVWQVYDFESRKWTEKKRAVYGTPEGDALLVGLNEKYQVARAAEDYKPHGATEPRMVKNASRKTAAKPRKRPASRRPRLSR